MSQHDERAPTNAISFDLEHWHSATLVRDAVERPVDRIERSVDIVLDLLDRHDVTATFFVVGEVAEEYPALVGEVHDAGHEIASHGHTHTPLFDLTPSEFRDELRDAAMALRRATGVDPEGFRAPNFSVDPRTRWALDVLDSEGYRYDSSVFPVRTPMYGVSDAPTRPYVVHPGDPFSATHESDPTGLVEVPVAVADPRFRAPIAGGFYARVTPVRVLEWGLRRLQRRGMPACIYFHPWEFNPAVPSDAPPPHARFVSFHGIDALPSKLDRLLDAFEWGPVTTLADDARGDGSSPVDGPVAASRPSTADAYSRDDGPVSND